MISANITAIEVWVQRILLALFAIFFLLPMLGMFAAKVDVEIYKDRESGEMTYCESGSLVDPPYIYMGSGKIDGDKASTC